MGLHRTIFQDLSFNSLFFTDLIESELGITLKILRNGALLFFAILLNCWFFVWGSGFRLDHVIKACGVCKDHVVVVSWNFLETFDQLG